jgi:hypothetical protein
MDSFPAVDYNRYNVLIKGGVFHGSKNRKTGMAE